MLYKLTSNKGDGAMQAADTVFMFLATMMVWIMTPGIALFYGGMVKSKNVLNTAMHSFMPMAVISILWVLVGYSLSFSEGNSLIGGFGSAVLEFSQDHHYQNKSIKRLGIPDKFIEHGKTAELFTSIDLDFQNIKKLISSWA